MKILVIGASGRVGKALIEKLTKTENFIIAGTRHLDDDFGPDVEKTLIDLNQSQEKLNNEIKNINPDAIYFTAGSRGDQLLQVDLFGAVKIQNAAENAGIKRFIQVSSFAATEPEMWKDESLTDYNIAKMFADSWLQNQTNLNYTIVQPGYLSEEKETGKIVTDSKDSSLITIPDVAQYLVDILDDESTYKKIIRITNN